MRDSEEPVRGGRAPTYQVELLLKLLIRIVDAKLFKAVDVEGFKAEQKGRQPPVKDSRLGRAHRAAAAAISTRRCPARR